MPYFRDRNLEDQEDQNGGSVQLSSAGVQAGPTGDPNESGTRAGGGTKSGSHFTNLDTYLSSNNGQALGQQVGQKVQGSIDQARTNIDNSVGEVRNQIQASSPAPSMDQINEKLTAAGKATTPDDISQYQGWLNQTYKGPASLSDNSSAYSRLTGGMNKAKAEANAVNTEAGRFSLLDQYFGRPNYSFGEKSLDNLLVQGGGGLNNTKAYQDQASQLGAYAKQGADTVAKEASQRQGDIESSRIAARTAIGLQDDGTVKGGALGTFQSTLDNNLKNLQTERSNKWAALTSDLSDTTIDGETQKVLGLQNGTDLYSLDLNKYLTKGKDPTRQQLATDDDYARYLALSQLAGLDPTYLTEATRDQAGADIGQYGSFDQARFNRDLANEQAQFQQQWAAGGHDAELDLARRFIANEYGTGGQDYQDAAYYVAKANALRSLYGLGTYRIDGHQIVENAPGRRLSVKGNS